MNPSGLGTVPTQSIPHSPKPAPHKCSESIEIFKRSGPIQSKFRAAGTIVEEMINATDDELKSCPKPHGFTLFHFIPMAIWVESNIRQQLFDRLINNPEMSKLISTSNEAISVDDLYIELNDGKKIPLANGDRPSHTAILFGTVKDIKQQLSVEAGTGFGRNCVSNHTGDNLFTLAAGRNPEIVEVVCNHFRSNPEKYHEYITHKANDGATPLHRAGSSHKAKKLEIFAKLITEGPVSSITERDNDNLTPLDHLKLSGKAQVEKLKRLIKQDMDTLNNEILMKQKLSGNLQQGLDLIKQSMKPE